MVIITYTCMAGMWGVAVTSLAQFGLCFLFLPVIVRSGARELQATASVGKFDLPARPFFPARGSVGNLLYTTIEAFDTLP